LLWLSDSLFRLMSVENSSPISSMSFEEATSVFRSRSASTCRSDVILFSFAMSAPRLRAAATPETETSPFPDTFKTRISGNTTPCVELTASPDDVLSFLKCCWECFPRRAVAFGALSAWRARRFFPGGAAAEAAPSHGRSASPFSELFATLRCFSVTSEASAPTQSLPSTLSAKSSFARPVRCDPSDGATAFTPLPRRSSDASAPGSSREPPGPRHASATSRAGIAVSARETRGEVWPVRTRPTASSSLGTPPDARTSLSSYSFPSWT